MRYVVQERCRKFNEPDVDLDLISPLMQWERSIMSLYNLTVPPAIMNWQGNKNANAEPNQTKAQVAVLLHCFTAFPKACPPERRDRDIWLRFVDVLNVLGPCATSVEWKAVGDVT